MGYLDTILQNQNKNKDTEKAPSTILDGALRLSNNGHATTTQLGQYGVGESMYDTEITPENVNQLNEIRGQHQGRFAKLGAGLANIVTGTALDLVGDVGYLLDTENYTDFKKSSEEGFNNWLTDWTNKTKEALKLPIYRTEDSKGFSPLSAGWWGDNMPSIASTVSMMLPAEGAVALLGKAGELLGGDKLIRGIEKVTGLAEAGVSLTPKLQGISGAIISRHMESLMEGGQTYQDAYNTALKATGDPEKAKQIAGEAAANNYKLNWAALVQDIPEYMLLHKTFKNSSKAFSKQGALEALKIAGIEGSEEAYQFVTDKEAKRDALINGKVLKDDNSSFGDRMLEYSTDGDFWTSAFLGAIGGAGFGLYGVSKDNKSQKSFDGLLEQHKGIINADPSTYKRGQDHVLNNAIVDNTANGTLDKFKSGLEAILASPERIKDEDRADVQKNVKSALEHIEYAKNIGYSVANDSSIPNSLKKTVFSTQLAQKAAEDRLGEINSQLNVLRGKQIVSTQITPDLLAYKEAKLTLEGIKSIPNLQGIHKELTKNVNTTVKDLLAAYPAFKTVEQLDEFVIGSQDEEFKKLLTNKEQENLIIKGAKEILYKSKTEEGKKDLSEKIEKVKKKEEKEVKQQPVKNIVDRISKGEKLSTPEDLQFYENNKKDIEQGLKEKQTTPEVKTENKPPSNALEAFMNGDESVIGNPDKVSNTPVIDENPEEVNSRGEENYEEYNIPSTYDKLKGWVAKALTVFKTENGTDDGRNKSSNRMFRWTNKVKLNGEKLLIVTKKSNLKLYNEILDQLDADGDDAKKFEEKNPTHKSTLEGIHLIVVDKDGTPIKEDGKYLLTNLTSVKRAISSDLITDKEGEDAANLIRLRDEIISKEGVYYLNITGKSKGKPQFITLEKGRGRINVEQAFRPIKQIEVHLVTLADITTPGYTTLGGNRVKVGKAYILGEEGRAYDLIPRTLVKEEVNKIIQLILDNNIKEVEKLIYWGSSNDKVYPWTIDNDSNGIIYLGGHPIDINSEAGIAQLGNFLSNKFVNINKNSNMNEEYTDIFGNSHASYKQYLLQGENPLFATDLKPKTEVQLIQQYLTYEPKLIQINKKVEENNTKPEEVLLSSKDIFEETPKPKKTNPLQSKDIKLNRLASVSKTTKLLTQQEKNWIKQVLPNIPIEKVIGLIEGNSFGQFLSNAKILLSDLATEGTLYHEAFHAITQLYLSSEEIDALYAEVRNRLNNPNLTDLEVEEHLAEDFANYKSTGEILKQSPKRNTFFRRILSVLRDFFNLKASTIQQVYERLDKGFYSNKKQVGNRQFTKLNKSFYSEDKEKAKTITYTNQILDGISSIFFKKLFELDATPDALFRGNNVGQILNGVDGVFDRLNANNFNEHTDWILDNWEEVVNKFVERLNAVGFDVSDSQLDSIEKQAEEVLTKESGVNGRQGEEFQEAGQISQKTTSSKSTRLLIRSLQAINKDGSIKKNELGLEVLVDYNRTYNFLLRELAGVGQSYEEMYNKIAELSIENPEFKLLLERLGPPSSNDNIDKFLFKSQFRQDFDKNQMDSLITMMSIDGEYYVISANRQAISDRVKDKWKANTASKGTQNADGRLIIPIDTNAPFKTFKDKLEFLKSIGIEFSEEAIAKIDTLEFEHATKAIRNKLIETNGDVTNLYASKKHFDESKNIRTLVELEANNNKDIPELSTINAAGKTIYSIGLNSFISKIKNTINNSKTLNELFNRLPHMKNIEGSHYLSELFDENGNRTSVNLEYDLNSGISTQSEDEAEGLSKYKKDTVDLTSGEKYLQDITILLQTGKSTLVQPSDKSTNPNTGLSGNKLIIPIDSLVDGFNTSKVKRIFTNYFSAEIRRMAFFTLSGENEGGKNVDQYSKHGWNYSLFKDFEFTGKKDITKAILALSKDASLSSEQKNEAVNALIETNKEHFFEGVIKYFNNLEKELTNDLKSKKVPLPKSNDEKSTIRAIAINDWINSVEQSKLYFGDMAFYKDLFKRLGGAIGGVQTLGTGDYFNNFLNAKNKRLDGKIANDKINVQVFSDVTQQSSYLNEYIDSIVESGLSEKEAKELLGFSKNDGEKRAYYKMDEGDAQGWISLDEYREFNLRLGDKKFWDEKFEKAHDKLIKQWKEYKQTGKISDKNLLTNDEIVQFKVLKAMEFGPQEYSGLYVPSYHKFSLMPLIPQLCIGKNLEVMLNDMINNQIGYRLFKSGSKVGTLVAHDIDINGDSVTRANKFYTENTNIEGKDGKKGTTIFGTHGEINTKDLITQVISYQFIGLQTKTSDPKASVIFGTQFRKLILSNLFNGGNTEWDKALIKEYDGIISNMVDREFKSLVNELGLNPDNYTVEDAKILVDKLKGESKSRDLPDNIVDALQTEAINGKLELKYKFDASMVKSKIDNMLMAIVNARVIRQHMNGDALVQGASSGFEKLGIREIGSNKELKFYTKGEKGTNSAECMIPMSKNYSNLLRRYKTVDGVNQAIKEGKIKEEELRLIGYRIPTQGLNSMDFFTIKEFTPEGTNAMILPTEIVAKSGGDYDIDKMNIFRPYFGVNQKASIEDIIELYERAKHEFEKRAEIQSKLAEGYVVPETGELSTGGDETGFFEELFTKDAKEFISKEKFIKNYLNKQANNRIIEIAHTILSDKRNFNSLIIPNSTHILTSTVDEFRYIKYANGTSNPISKEEWLKAEENNLKNIRYSHQLDITTKNDMFVRFMLAKKMIGIAAVANTSHTIAQQYDWSINKDYLKDLVTERFEFRYKKSKKDFTKEQLDTLNRAIELSKIKINFAYNENKDGTISLSNTTDVNGVNKISEVISQIINATVDAAKDPFLFDLSMNLETLSTYIYLIRIGVEFEDVAYFMKQPILQEYFSQLDVEKSGYLKAYNKNLSKSGIAHRLLMEYMDKLGFEYKERDTKNSKYSSFTIDTKHFIGVKSINDLRKEYKKLAVKNHPDKGGNTQTMQEINNEYDFLKKHPELIGAKRDEIITEEEPIMIGDEDISYSLLNKERLKEFLHKDNQNSQEFYKTQIQVLEDYLKYKDQSNLLLKAVQATNHDTSGLSENLEATDLKLKQIQEALDDGFVNGIQRVLNPEESFIGKMNLNSEGQKMYNQFYETRKKQEFVDVNNNILATVNPFTNDEKLDLSKLAINDLINYVIQNYGFINSQGESIISDIREKLFKGENSAAKQLLALKRSNLKQDEKLKDNRIIKELFAIIDTLKDKNGKAKPNNQDNIKLFTRRIDRFTSDQLTESFRELKDANPDLYRSIVRLGVLQSGLNNSPITYIGLIPYEYYNELVKQAFKNFDKKNGVNDLYKFEQLFYRNNINNSIIKKARLEISDKLGEGMYGKDYDLKNYIPLEEDEKQYKKIPKKIDRENISETKKEIGVKSSNYEYSGLEKNLLLERLRIFNKLNSTRHSIDFTKIGEADLYKGNFHFNNQFGIQFNKTEGEQQVSREVLTTLLDRLKDKLNINYQFINSGDSHYLNGVAYININDISLDTGIHEMSHPLFDALEKHNPKLFTNILESILKTEEGARILATVSKLYSEDFKDGVPSNKALKEIGVRALTEIAKKNINPETGKPFLAAIKRLFYALKQMFRSVFGKDINISDLNENTTLQELADMLTIGKGKINLHSKEEIQYTFKAVQKITNNLDKIRRWEKDVKNPPIIFNKIQKDLGIPKEQIELLKNSEGNTIEEKLVDFVTKYSYSVEVKTTKQDVIDYSNSTGYTDSFQRGSKIYNKNNKKYWFITVENNERSKPNFITKEDYERAKTNNFENTQHYSNLTVPGGTNYTENEISTPLITPSIKGHAQFSTNEGIGWFRSDEQTEGGKKTNVQDRDLDYHSEDPKDWHETSIGGNVTKTRRILEVQSDLFQKGRDKDNIIKIENLNIDTNGTQSFNLNGNIYSSKNRKFIKNINEISEDEFVKAYIDKFGNLKKEENDNQFLQLLNKDNNWVTFFIKSIIQDSAKKGYEKVLFPSGNTASKVEGHETLEDFQKQKEISIARIESALETKSYELDEKELLKESKVELNPNNEYYKANGKWYQQSIQDNGYYDDLMNDANIAFDNGSITSEEFSRRAEAIDKEFRDKEVSEDVIKSAISQTNEESKYRLETELQHYKDELERVRTGQTQLSSIAKFYENTIKNILKKNYTINEITDEYGNTWNEVTLSNKDLENIQFKKKDTLEGADSTQGEGGEAMPEVKKEEPKELSKIEQYYYRRISRLTKELALAQGVTRKLALGKELIYTEQQLTKHNLKSSQEEADLEFGQHTLDLVRQKIDLINEGNTSNLSNDMEYIEEVLSTWDTDDIPELKTDIAKLRNKLKPIKNKFIEETTGHSLEDINKQNKDIGSFKMGTGSLLDLSNILANTIGKLISSSQTKIERKNKALQKEITDKIKSLEKSSGKSAIDLFKEIIYTSKKGKKSLIDEKYLDEKIISKEALEFYHFYKEKMKELVDITPAMTYKDDKGELNVFNLDDNFIPNVPIDKTLADKLKENKNPLRLLGIVKTRKVGDFTRDEEQKADIIPIEYIKSLEANEKSDDLGEALYLFASSIHNYEEMSKVLPKARILQREIYNRNYIQGSDPNTTKSKEDSNLYKIVQGYIEAQIKGNYKAPQGKHGYNQRTQNGNTIEDYVDITGTIDGLLRWNSLVRIGLSPVGAASNWIFGKISDFIEAVGGEFFNVREFMLADKIFYQQTFDKDSVLNKELLSKWNVLQEMTDYHLQEATKSGKARYLSGEKLIEMLYIGQKSGEKAAQSNPLLAMMLHNNYMTKDGKLTDKWNNSSEEEKEKFILAVTGVNNRLHGRYTVRESSIWSQHVMFRAISQFRKYIVTGIETRLDKKHYSPRFEKEIEGRYITAFNKIFDKNVLYNLYAPLFEAKKAVESGKFTEHEVANMRKNLIETVLLIGTALLMGIGKGDDDKKLRKNKIYKAYLLSLNRISGDIDYFYNPKNVTSLLKNAVPAAKLIDDIIYLGRDVFSPNYVLKGGNAKGSNRLLKNLTDVLPGKGIITDPFKILNKNILDESRQ